MTTEINIETKATRISCSDELLLSNYEYHLRIAAVEERLAGQIEQEIISRIRERGASALPSETFIVELEVKNTYDQVSLTPLLEIFNAVELAKCYEPAYSKTVEVPAKWKVQQVIAAAKRRGAEALAVVERAKIPGAPKLTFRRRE